MVESLKELNKLCQKEDYKTKGNWMVCKFLREAALPFTWLLLHTRVTANQVTLAALGVGILGTIFLAFPERGWFLFGTLLLQFWYYLDHVDGQIARYRKTSSLTGRFFDFIMHHLIHGIVFFGLAGWMYAMGNSAFYLVWGFVACLSIITFNLVHDTKYKTFFERLSLEKRIEFKPASKDPDSKTVVAEPSWPKRIFSFVHKSSEIHVLMNIWTLVAFIQVFISGLFDLRPFLYLYYGFAFPFLAIVKLTYLIIHQEIDREFKESFHISES